MKPIIGITANYSFDGSSEFAKGIGAKEQEFTMLRYLLGQTNKPILGICRGIQVINTALGGTLIQHIPDSGFSSHTLPMYPRQIPSHRAKVEKGSLLYSLVDCDSMGVNSFHHMAGQSQILCKLHMGCK